MRERDCEVVKTSLDMNAVVCLASEFILFMFTHLVFLLSRLGKECNLSMS